MEVEPHFEHFQHEFVSPANSRKVSYSFENDSFCYRASLKPPFFALQSGDLMARVMTTSSGFFLSRAESPDDLSTRCADTCLIRCIVNRKFRCYKREIRRNNEI